MKLAYSGVLLASVFFSPNGVLGVGREFEGGVLIGIGVNSENRAETGFGVELKARTVRWLIASKVIVLSV